MDTSITKLCLDCGAPVPATVTTCRDCARKRAKAKRRREARRRQKALDEIERKSVETLIQSAAQGGSNIPHSAELTEQLMLYFGGVNGFAAMFTKQYHEAPPGGSMRTRMLETMTRLVSANTAMGGAQKPLSVMSDEELEAELNDKLREVAAVVARRRSIDGTIEEAPAQPACIGTGPASDGPAGFAVSAPPADGVAGGAGEPEVRVPEALPADRPPGGVPSVHGA